MSKGLQWLIGIGVVLVVAAMVFSFVAPFFLARVGLTALGTNPQFGDGRNFGAWGPGHMFGGRSMMGGLHMPWGGFGMFIGPLVVIGLIVLAVVLLTRKSPAPMTSAQISAPAPAVPPAAASPCAHCGQPLEASWKACPHCGEKV